MNQSGNTTGTSTISQANGSNGLNDLATSQSGNGVYANGNVGQLAKKVTVTGSYTASQNKLPQTGNDTPVEAVSLAFGLLGIAMAGAGVTKKRRHD